MSARRAGLCGPGTLAPGVVVVVEQLRRSVPGGIGTYATGLVKGLGQLERGGERPFPVSLHASRPSRLSGPSRTAGSPGSDPLERLGEPVRCSFLPGWLLVKAWELGMPIGEGARALVHGVSLAFPRADVPVVVTVHDLCWRRFPESYPPRGRRWHEGALRRAARLADAFVVPSAAVGEELIGAGLSIRADQVAVIEEGADHLPPADEQGARRILSGLGVAGPFLLAVGTLEPRKNLRRLVAAYGQVRAELAEPWPLVVVGPTGWGEAIGPVPDGVVLAGRVGDAQLSALYGLARCLAYVPLAEGFGLPVVEAMRAGLPVVSSEVPSASGASLLVDPLDVDSIGDGLSRAAGDEELRRCLVTAGSSRAAGLTWERAAKAHVKLWERVAGEGRVAGKGRGRG